MTPFIVQQIAEDHYRDLVQLARSAHAADGLKPVRCWRRRVGQALVSLGVGVGLPRQRRAAALSEARRLLICGSTAPPSTA